MAAAADNLDELDRVILNRIQHSVPLAARPFAVLAAELGTTEAEMLARVQRLASLGIVRRLGPILDYAAWGMAGVLVAAKVDAADLALAEDAVHDYPEITHAYLRDHAWNLWFTVIAENETSRDAIIARVVERARLREVRRLPQQKTFKLAVRFSL